MIHTLIMAYDDIHRMRFINVYDCTSGMSQTGAVEKDKAIESYG